MASFTQDLPQRDPPNWMNYSSPISQPEGNKALGIALEGLGKAFEGTVAYMDRSNKQAIDAAIDKGVESNRDAQIATLETIAGIPADQRVTPADKADTTLIPRALGGGADVPADVEQETESATNAAGSLSSASGAGKIPLTYYRGRDDMLRKDLRARYPGYLDYIDSKMGNTGNAYMNDLLREISSRQSAMSKELNKDVSMISEMAKAGVTSAPAAYQNRVSGRWGTAQVLNWIAQEQSFKRQGELLKAEWETLQTTNNIKQDRAMEIIGDLADQHVQKSLIQLSDGTYMDINKMNQFITDYANGKIKKDDPYAGQILQAMKAHRSKVQADIMKDISTSSQINAKEEGHYNDSLVQSVKDMKRIEDRIKTSFTSLDYMIDIMEKGDFALAKSQAIENKAIIDNSSNKLFNSVDLNVRNYAILMGVAKNLGGDGFVAAIKDLYGTGKQPNLDALYKHFANSLATQQGPIKTIDQALKTLSSHNFGSAEGKGAYGQAKAVEERQVTQSILSLPKLLTSAEINDMIKNNIVMASYGEENNGILLKFEHERVDQHGNVIPGRNAIFQNMTTPDQAKEIARLAGKNPKLWTNYTDWVENAFTIIYGDNVRELTAIAENSVKDKRIDVKYNAVEQKFVLNWVNPTGDSLAHYGNVKKSEDLKRVEEQVNRGLSAVANIAKIQGSDPNAYVLLRMAASNAKVGPDSVAGKMLRAVIASNKPTEEKTKK